MIDVSACIDTAVRSKSARPAADTAFITPTDVTASDIELDDPYRDRNTFMYSVVS